MLHFIQKGDGGPVSVGRGEPFRTIRRWWRQGSKGSSPIIVLAVAPIGAESEVRERLQPHRVRGLRGRWYEPVPEVLGLIEEVRSPRFPEYRVASGRAYAVLRRRTPDGPTLPCPFCGRPHQHGEGEGHKVAHCAGDSAAELRGRDVTLRQSDGYFVIVDESI